MQPGRASRTAQLVAWYRALDVVLNEPPILGDPYAVRMLPYGWRWPVQSRILRAVVIRLLGGPRLRAPIVTFVARSRIAEDLLAERARRGPVQWVLLGAGLDTFAWRHPEHAGLAQFEVDHPDTQRSKCQLLAELHLAPPAKHRFCAVDFEKTRLRDALPACGFDPAVPAVFAWLGVTYYLTREAIVSTLSEVGSIAAPGSALVCDYRVPDRLLAPDEREFARKGDEMLAKWGEPHLTKLEPEGWPDLAAPLGWEVEADLGPEEITARFGRGHRAISNYRVLTLART